MSISTPVSSSKLSSSILVVLPDTSTVPDNLHTTPYRSPQASVDSTAPRSIPMEPSLSAVPKGPKDSTHTNDLLSYTVPGSSSLHLVEATLLPSNAQVEPTKQTMSHFGIRTPFVSAQASKSRSNERPTIGPGSTPPSHASVQSTVTSRKDHNTAARGDGKVSSQLTAQILPGVAGFILLIIVVVVVVLYCRSVKMRINEIH